MLKPLIRRLAARDKRWDRLYLRVCAPEGLEYAEFLRRRGDFHSMGKDCYIDRYALICDRPYIRIGNNVRLATCTLLGHDGAVNMINRCYGLKLDSVGKIDIRDNVYIGYGAILLPGITIGPNAIISAGAVVRGDVKEGDIVAGAPAKRAGRLEMSVAILKAKNARFPWRHLIEQREGEYDAELEPELIRARVEHFFGTNGEGEG